MCVGEGMAVRWGPRGQACPLVERIATDSRVMRAGRNKAGKIVDEEKKLREEEVAMKEMQHKEAYSQPSSSAL